jgi:hypothetical protein
MGEDGENCNDAHPALAARAAVPAWNLLFAVWHWTMPMPNAAFSMRSASTFGCLAMRSRNALKLRAVPVIDAEQQFALARGDLSSRHKVLDNLPGTAAFCPLVRRTPALQRYVEKQLPDHSCARANDLASLMEGVACYGARASAACGQTGREVRLPYFLSVSHPCLPS